MAFGGAFSGEVGAVSFVNIRGDEFGAEGVGAGDDDGGDVFDVSSEAGGDEVADVLAGGDEDFSSEVAAFLFGGELIFVVDGGGAGTDHGFAEFKGVERSSEACFGVCHDGEEVVGGGVAFGVVDLVGTDEGVVDAAHHFGDRVVGVEGLVGVGGGGGVAVGGNLPAGEVDGAESGFGHFHGLVAGDGAEGGDVGVRVEEVPEFAGAVEREGVFFGDASAELGDVLGGVGSFDSVPARVGVPVFGDFGGGAVGTVGGCFVAARGGGHGGVLCCVEGISVQKFIST